MNNQQSSKKLHIHPDNVTNILRYFDKHEIHLTVDLNNPSQLLKCEQNTYNKQSYNVPFLLPAVFEFVHDAIVGRLCENLVATNYGWLVSNFGDVYSHQYGLQNYVFIERNFDGSVDVYRCRFNKDHKADNIKNLGTHVNSFQEARDLAANFLDWFYSKSMYGRRPY